MVVSDLRKLITLFTVEYIPHIVKYKFIQAPHFVVFLSVLTVSLRQTTLC